VIRVGCASSVKAGQREGKGRAMRNTRSVYFDRTTDELRRLYSKKYNRYLKLDPESPGWWNSQELRILSEQMRSIKAILESRRLQLRLPE